jgi:UDP-N-acetylmuramoyl-tripeptide--D-alanyl-D-alanine ligase
MLQSTEYQVWPYLRWFWRTQDFSKVERRRQLIPTRPAHLLLLLLRVGMVLQIIIGALMLYWWLRYGLVAGWEFGLALLLSYPVVWAHAAVVPLVLGRIFVEKPLTAKRSVAAQIIFRNHSGLKIAVAGSYGKTSMKELLRTVLGEGKTVAATPANKNVALSHAAFARSLTGHEDILIIEYGEGAPGDVARFAQVTHPTHAVITGVAPAHLDHYKTIEAAGKDIFSVAPYVADKTHIYVNGESPAAAPFMEPDFVPYDQEGTLGWAVSKVKVGVEGTSFTIKKDKETMRLTSGLLGRHQVGPLVLAAALGKAFGMSDGEVLAGIAKTQPFEHRMQPYQLNGAWIIDDTYNGNLEGIRAGTQLLGELPATEKIYVTPGLVDQGHDTEAIHKEIGQLIAGAKPNVVILMRNSVTASIQQGLAAAGFSGDMVVEDDPLQFYMNLGHFVATGDLVMLQNDWPDNYA